MPAIPPQELIEAIIGAIRESGASGVLISPIRRHPRRFAITNADGSSTIVSIYIWTLTHGGRQNLPNEYRIQMTSVESPLEVATDGPTVLMGYEPEGGLFAGFDLERHRTFATGSPSVQIDIEELRTAELEGLSFHRKTNDEIAVGIRPDQFLNYVYSADRLHRFGREAQMFRLLNRAVTGPVIPAEEVSDLSTERRRVLQTVSRLARLATFRQKVLFAYGHRCAVTRVQLRLVDAAHILPVGAPGSTDDVRNGIALSPTYHRAFDNGLIYLDERMRMQVNTGELGRLEQMNLAKGLELFRAPLGRVFLPPDRRQWPAVDFIRRANRFRSV